MQQTNQEEKEIDLLALCKMLLKHIKLIIILALICGIGTFSATKFLMTPQYTASVSIYVNNTKDVTTDRINSTDLTASQQLVNTYITIIKSNMVVEQVVEAAKLPYTIEEVKNMMTASAVDGTEIFSVNIQNADPEVACKLVNTFADVAPQIIMDYVEGSSVKVVDYAKVPTAPSSPNTTKNTAIGILIGLVLGIGISLIMELANNYIHSEEELEQLYAYPVLGVVPDFESADQAKGYKKYDYRYYPSGHTKGAGE